MPTAAAHVWVPSCARVVRLDGFVPVPRGTPAAAPALASWPAKDPTDVLDYQFDITAALLGNTGDGISSLDVGISPSNPGDLVMKSCWANGAAGLRERLGPASSRLESSLPIIHQFGGEWAGIQGGCGLWRIHQCSRAERGCVTGSRNFRRRFDLPVHKRLSAAICGSGQFQHHHTLCHRRYCEHAGVDQRGWLFDHRLGNAERRQRPAKVGVDRSCWFERRADGRDGGPVVQCPRRNRRRVIPGAGQHLGRSTHQCGRNDCEPDCGIAD